MHKARIALSSNKISKYELRRVQAVSCFIFTVYSCQIPTTKQSKWGDNFCQTKNRFDFSHSQDALIGYELFFEASFFGYFCSIFRFKMVNKWQKILLFVSCTLTETATHPCYFLVGNFKLWIVAIYQALEFLLCWPADHISWFLYDLFAFVRTLLVK